MRKPINALSVIFILLIFLSCPGGVPEVAFKELKIEITGLLGSLSIKLPGGDALSIDKDGTYVASTNLVSGQGYALQVLDSPPHQDYIAVGMSGTVQDSGAITTISFTNKAKILHIAGKKVFINPSNQSMNAVAGGGTEAEYALAMAQRLKAAVEAVGGLAMVDLGDWTSGAGDPNYNPIKAASEAWGADIVISLHSNAGGGHGQQARARQGDTASASFAGTLLSHCCAASSLANRGVTEVTTTSVLKGLSVPTVLFEVCFHDCASTAGFAGHPPSESSLLKSTVFQDLMAGECIDALSSFLPATPPPLTPTSLAVVPSPSVALLSWSRAGDAGSQDPATYFLISIAPAGQAFPVAQYSSRSLEFRLKALPAGSYRAAVTCYHPTRGESVDPAIIDFIIP